MNLSFQGGQAVIAAGTVTRDAEFKRVGAKNSAVASFSMAAGKNADTTTIFISVKAWRSLAHVAAQAKKGDAVIAVGHYESRDWEGKKFIDLVCDWLHIIPKDTISNAQPVNMYSAPAPSFDDIEDDGPLPF